MRIAVVAMGKIGLPLAVQFARMGHTVIGADVNEATVALVNAGTAPFPGENHLPEYLAEVVADGRLRATTDTAAAVRESEAVVVVVPLFVDENGIPDFRAMDAATTSIAAGLTPGTLVSYETTLPVGTTRDRFGPMLAEGSGLSTGTDFLLVFSPERVFTGRVFADLARYPKLVGGIDDTSTKAGLAFYSAVLEFDERDDLPQPNGVWDLGTAEAAEMAKLAETTYRDVNIGLANEFARFADKRGIDIQLVIDACNSQPFSHIHRPGIAVGGHCIPIYPRFYLWNDPEATIVAAARQANADMPQYAVTTVTGLLGGLAGKRVAVLGISYRGGVKESAFSGVFPTVAAIRAGGGEARVHDPMYSDDEVRAMGFEPYALGDPADAVIVQSDHAQYRELSADELPTPVILDGRRVLDPHRFPGVTLVTIGGGSTALQA